MSITLSKLMFTFFVSVLVALPKPAFRQNRTEWVTALAPGSHMDMMQEARNLFLLEGECGKDPQVYKQKKPVP